MSTPVLVFFALFSLIGFLATVAVLGWLGAPLWAAVIGAAIIRR